MLHLVGTHLAVFPGLEDPEQEGLGLQRELGDLVQEERSPVGILEIALARFRRPGEGTLDMTEQFGIDQFLGEGAAVDDEETGAAAGGILMDDPRDVFLADTALPENDHAQVRRGELDGRLQRLVQRRIVADDIVFVLQCL